MDVRDIAADLATWEWSWPHIGQTTIDVIAFIPVIGAFKYADEAAVLVKSGDKILLVKHADDLVGTTKHFDEVVVGTKSVRDILLESVSNQKLKNCINEMYRKGATVGDGGLADAIRYEITTGELVGGKSHIQKGLERVKNLENIIKNQNLNNDDLKIATKLLNDLKSALALGGN